MNYNNFNPLKVEGKMTSQKADKAGLILAIAISIALVLFSLATVISAVRWW